MFSIEINNKIRIHLVLLSKERRSSQTGWHATKIWTKTSHGIVDYRLFVTNLLSRYYSFQSIYHRLICNISFVDAIAQHSLFWRTWTAKSRFCLQKLLDNVNEWTRHVLSLNDEYCTTYLKSMVLSFQCMCQQKFVTWHSFSLFQFLFCLEHRNVYYW
jgi:hypothetical protein